LIMMVPRVWKKRNGTGISKMKKNEKYVVREADLIKSDVSAYLKRHEEKDMLRFLVAGSVDDGKSTLIGRLLYDSQMIYEDQLATLLKDSSIHGSAGDDFDPALLTDGLKAEREQGITIDTAYRYFSSEKRSFIICDTPGHEQYTRNMATGASHCNLAIVLIDARHGVMPQTKRHSFIATLLGIKHLVIAVSKMDAVDYDQKIYRQIRKDYESFAAKLDISDIHFIPMSALKGDNVVDRSKNMPWFQGAPLLSYLEDVQIASDRNLIDLRLPIQYVIRPDLNFRGFAGSMASGIIRKGESVVVLPSGQQTTIDQIFSGGEPVDEAFAPQAVTITTTDEVDISRGSMLSKPNNMPIVGSHFDATLVWMHEQKLTPGSHYLLKSNTQTVPAVVTELRYKFDVNELHRQSTGELNMNDIGRVAITTHRPLCFDAYSRNHKTGSFILIDTLSNATVGAGIIIEQAPETHQERSAGKDPVSKNINWESNPITAEERKALLGHSAATIWLTGLSGSGKSTIAQALEKRLVTLGVNAFILDGDNVRHGLNRDLGFSADDRTENIRRIAEVGKLMNDAGMIVVTAFISPYRDDRMRASDIIGDNFFEVHVSTSLDVCRQRDPKGLYKKVAEGKLKSFTGISAPYEAPLHPALTLDSDKMSLEEEVEAIVEVLRQKALI
jgi:bifunctional enzyme CysN/CysC